MCLVRLKSEIYSHTANSSLLIWVENFPNKVALPTFKKDLPMRNSIDVNKSDKYSIRIEDNLNQYIFAFILGIIFNLVYVHRKIGNVCFI